MSHGIRNTFALLILSAVLLFSQSVVAADERSYSSGSRPGLSQLEFDRPINKSAGPEAQADGAPALDPEQIELILGDDGSPQSDSEKNKPSRDLQPVAAVVPGVKSGSGKGSTSVVSPDLDPSPRVPQPVTDVTFLAPRLKGPEVDTNSPSLITTKLHWNKGKRDGCKATGSVANSCQKSLALKELLLRFTGHDDFYFSQCNKPCTTPGEVPRMVSFTVQETKGGSFSMVEDKSGKCHYQLGRAAEGSWVALEPGTVSCACISESCK